MHRLQRGWLLILVLVGLGVVAGRQLIPRFLWDRAPVVVSDFQDGLTYTNQRIARVPWSIHVLGIDRADTHLTFYSSHAGKRVLAVSLISHQAQAVPGEIGKAIAGVNGDFYVRDDPAYAGDPRGLQISNGELISGPTGVCTWFDLDGNPHLDDVTADFTVTWPDGQRTPFGLNERRSSSAVVLFTPAYANSTRAPGGRELVLENEGAGPWLPLQCGQKYRGRVKEVSTRGDTRLGAGLMVLSIGPQLASELPGVGPGAILELSTGTNPDLAKVKTAIGGGPAIIQQGVPFALTRPPAGSSHDFSERSKYERHPRSAIGWSSTRVYLVVVDGRQPGLSKGMTLAELAQFMTRLGCTEAMNLDGGKSAQMWLNGRIVNSPCQGEDTVANSLLVIRRPGENR